jgi:ATP-dependent DNA helicase RecG
MALDGLPLNLADLLNGRSIESNRIEFKTTWSEPTRSQVVQTVCAFANDLLNLGGGYVVLGVAEEQGRAVLPPVGLGSADLDRLQKEIRGVCMRIEPPYQPMVFPVSYEGAPLLVIFAPGGDTRPYETPEDAGAKASPRHYYIRRGSQTLRADADARRQLFEIAAKVPFDDRRNLEARVEDISPLLVRRFLHDVRSGLLDTPGINEHQIYRQMNLLMKVNAHEVPRNVALLFFNEDPDRFFPGARTEIVQFGDDAGGDLLEERVFRGPIPTQIRSALEHLNSLGGTLLQKIRGQAEVERTVPYPYAAMEEAIGNAFYHRSYEAPPEPVKIYLYPDRMEIISYPGPVPGIQRQHLELGHNLPPVPARNRRIGDFLKELKLAERRGTGIPKIQQRMRENGSPEARFDFDEERTYFRAILPVHPRYEILNALREAGHLWAIGERKNALAHLERSFERQPNAAPLANQIIEYAFALDDREAADRALERIATSPNPSPSPFLTMARLLVDHGKTGEASRILGRMPPQRSGSDTLAEAILRKRTNDLEGAHRLFAQAYAANPDDPKLVHEFAQTKIGLARRKRADLPNKKRLFREAAELLRRAIQLADSDIRAAWCWFDLARTLDWLGAPSSEIETAFLRAISLLPEERRFRQRYDDWKSTPRRGEGR